MSSMDKAQGLIGLCARARQLASGESACELALRGGKAALVLIDQAASDNTKKKFTDACAYRRVPLCMLPEDMLGQAIGKPGRMTATIPPGNLAKQLLVLLSPDNTYISVSGTGKHD